MKRAFLFPLLLSLITLASCSGTAYVHVFNDHQSVTIGPTTYWDPQIGATVNGETKLVPWGAEEEWVIEWIGFRFFEDVSVQATITSPSLSNGGSFTDDFQVKDGDEKTITVTYCSGWAP
jgi:hypothetical protein